MNSDITRDFLSKVFEGWRNTGSIDSWLDALDEDLVWTVTGSKENSGVYKTKQVYIDEVLAGVNKWVKRPPIPTLNKLIVEGEWATALLQAEAESLDGKTFTMEYCWIMRVHNDKVTEVIGFYA